MIKIVEKPWGQEEWIELNDKYCVKRITIDPNNRTSLQYHDYKMETMVVAEGKLHITINGIPAVLSPGESITITPGTKHRLEAITDKVVLYEMSTPEVNDVNRLEDDYGR